MIKHLIWTNDLDYERDWKEDLEAEYPDMTNDEREELMYELNAGHLDNERINLDIPLKGEIIAIADLGLWNGRRMGYREINSNNVADCLYSERDIDYSTWYLDERGDLCCDAVHHDGSNHICYREFKDELSDTQKENFKYKVYRGKATRADITRYTRSIGKVVAKVYGWGRKEV